MAFLTCAEMPLRDCYSLSNKNTNTKPIEVSVSLAD